MNKQKGFSLIELLIVVAIILIIAAIAVPNLLKAKMAANEASAAASERTIGTANVTFSSAYNNGFALTLLALGPPAAGVSASSTAGDLIDSTLAAAIDATHVKTGYFFTYTAAAAAPSTTFSLVGQPQTANSTGNASFCLDQTNVLKKDPAGTTTGAAATGCGTYAGIAM